jgi:hypothetical protein
MYVTYVYVERGTEQSSSETCGGLQDPNVRSTDHVSAFMSGRLYSACCFRNVSNKLHLPFLLRMMVLNKVSDHRRCGRWGFFPKSWDPGKFHCYPVVLIADRKTLGSFTFPLVNPPFGEPTGVISYLFDALQHIQDLHLTNIDGNNFIPWFPCWLTMVLYGFITVISICLKKNLGIHPSPGALGFEASILGQSEIMVAL